MEDMEDSSGNSSDNLLDDELLESEEESKGKKSSKKKASVKEDTAKKEKQDEMTVPKSEAIMQSNIDDLEERFKRLALQVAERNSQENPMPRLRLYCVMCGVKGHGI